MQIDHSSDLKKLWDEGYDLQIRQGHLFIGNVPYVNSQKEVKRGVLVSVLNLNGDQTIKPENHVAYFKGELPCSVKGEKINIVVSDSKVSMAGDIVDYTLSAKADYNDYYEKITRYINTICSHATEIDPSATAKTFEFIEVTDEDSVFNYVDTNSSRALINPITNKLKNQKIAIIGLGGTGSYVLDLVAKTPVQEIHLFDGDNFLQHNAFRAPGAPAKVKFFEHLKKVDYLREIYSNMHKNIFPHAYFLDHSNVAELIDKDFVFICIDSGKQKKEVVTFLRDKKISFTHTGLSLQDIDGSIKGQVKLTTCTPDKSDHLTNRISFQEQENNIYDQNIQIADLNALNATLAVLKWKKLFGFYKDLDREHFTSFVTFTNETTNDDFPA